MTYNITLELKGNETVITIRYGEDQLRYISLPINDLNLSFEVIKSLVRALK
jgi:hypothetical protein